MDSLNDIYRRLQSTRTSTQIGLVNTRLMLKTGVNLKAINPAKDRDAATVAKVSQTLRDLGVAV